MSGSITLWLDWKLFGNGYGMASPICDDTFFWLKDSITDKQRLYTHSIGFGSQLSCCEWRTPRIGEERVLMNQRFVVVLTQRRGPRVIVEWSLVGEVDLARLTILKNHIHEWRHGRPAHAQDKKI